MANSQDDRPSQHSDLLAAVVLHTLITGGGEGVSLAHIATACQRDPTDIADIYETEAALKILLEDGLAEQREELYRPTRAAIRACELSF